MSRYIDADKLCELYTEMKWLSFGDACQAWLAAKIAPTAEVVKRGRWEVIDKGHGFIDWKCSVCGGSGRGDYLICPWCGAAMDEVEE